MPRKTPYSNASFLILVILLAGSVPALAQGSLPQAPDYRGEIRRGADGKLMVIPAPEPPAQKPSGDWVPKATMVAGPGEKAGTLTEAARLAGDDTITIRATVRNHVASDIGQGWSSTNYIPSLGKFLAIFVNHYSPSGYQDNSLRAFDPATNTIQYIHPKNAPGAPQDRDNHNMLYNPFTKKIWIVSGDNHLVLDVASAWANRNVAPGYGAVGWSASLNNAAFGTAADIKNWPSDFMKWNSMVAWHDSLDIGVIFSGVSYTGMGVSNDLYLIKRNPTPNEQRYVFINAGNFDSVLAPPGYARNYIYTSTFNGRHNGRILGNYFYFLSVDPLTSRTSLGGQNYSLKYDLYRYDLLGPVGMSSLVKMAPLTFTVTQSSPPAKDYGMDFPCVTADKKVNVILVRLAAGPPANLFAYLPESNTWQQVQADVPVRHLRLGACDYSPDYGTTGIHAYQDGKDSTGNSPSNPGWGTIVLTRDFTGTGVKKRR